MNKMDQKVKRKWVAKLRSGTVRQGQGALAKPDNNGHLKRCCLGVLCDVVGAKRSKGLNGASSYTYKGDSDQDILPRALCTELGISSDAMDHLVQMNDGGPLTDEHYSFREIADWIDANL